MATNITVRLSWHMNGWNGSVCKDPRANTYCAGRYSYPGDAIAKNKDEKYEVEHAGKPCALLNKLLPCALSCNAFGKETIPSLHQPPEWFAGAKAIKADVPPSTVFIWPYEQMYTEEVMATAKDGRKYNNDLRRKLAKEYFDQLIPNESILVYYANNSNPFSEEEKQRYIVVGISRLGQPVGRELFYEDVPDDIKIKNAGGIVWQRSLCVIQNPTFSPRPRITTS